MDDIYPEVRHADFERSCARIERDREMFVYSPARAEGQWWMGYLDYMESLDGFDARAWLSTVESWLARLEHIGSPVDDARDELDRMRRERK